MRGGGAGGAGTGTITAASVSVDVRRIGPLGAGSLTGSGSLTAGVVTLEMRRRFGRTAGMAGIDAESPGSSRSRYSPDTLGVTPLRAVGVVGGRSLRAWGCLRAVMTYESRTARGAPG